MNVRKPKNNKEWRELLGKELRVTIHEVTTYRGILENVVGRNILIDGHWLWRADISEVELIEEEQK